MVGIATSFRRETLWCLATYAVRPAVRGRASASRCSTPRCTTAAAAPRGMLSASSDPKAVRVYHQAGFELHPQMYLTGTVDRSALPVVEKVREGRAADIELMDSLDRRTRGAGARARTTS